ncbi:M1 family metallopeptidase [Streptomyces sp. NBC_01267]|uniref:M1 family metallopeptidase n=1 Tax=unclassified Streptomyces TaxID=2593676 RepID=UPI00202522F5|nr:MULTISPECIES: M1 family metallopeptidase [unclassified Streptomyces]
MDQYRRRTAAPAALTAVLSLLAACSAGVHGRPGGDALHDPYFPRVGNGGYDVQHYGLTLDYDPDTDRLRGTADITARANEDLSAFNLDFTGMKVDGATVDGAYAPANRAGSELTLRPHHDLDRGATFRTVVRYSGEPETLTDPDSSQEGWLPNGGGALALGEPVGSMAWFPGNDHPSDKATYDITVTVPEGLQAVSNGELTSQRTTAGRTTFHWHCAEPMATYLATVAIGPYKTHSYKAPSGLPVFTAVDPDEEEKTASVVARVPEIVAWESKKFGPYPFDSTGVIIAPEKSAGYSLETQTRPVLPGDQASLSTLVHELSHQWFGDSVTPESWRDMWLNEGFATYAAWMWDEDHGGKSVEDHFDDAYQEAANWAFPPADPPGPKDISASPVYGRGAMVLDRIRRTVGDDAFFAMVRGWAKDHRYGNVSTSDFTAYAEKKTGKDLSGIWATWLYGKDKPAEP